MRATNMNESRHELIEKQVAEFLASGGEIEQVPTSIYDHEYRHQHPPLNHNVTDTRNARVRAMERARKNG